MQDAEVDPNAVACSVASTVTNGREPYSSTSEIRVQMSKSHESCCRCGVRSSGGAVIGADVPSPSNHTTLTLAHVLKQCTAGSFYVQPTCLLIRLRSKFVAVCLSYPANVLTHSSPQSSQIQGLQAAAGIKGHG